MKKPSLKNKENKIPFSRTKAQSVTNLRVPSLASSHHQKRKFNQSELSDKMLSSLRSKSSTVGIINNNKKLEKENDDMKKLIKENKSSHEKSKQDILGLVKAVTLIKLGHEPVKKEEYSKNGCKSMCNEKLEREILRLQLRRYELEKEEKEFNESKKKYMELKSMIREAKNQTKKGKFEY